MQQVVQRGSFYWAPGPIDSGALTGETVSATLQPSTADYTNTQTIPVLPPAAVPMIQVNRDVIRIRVNVGSWTGSGTRLAYAFSKDGNIISTITAAAQANLGATAITVAPLTMALSTGAQFVFNDETHGNVIVTLTAPAYVGATSIACSAISAQINTGTVGNATLTTTSVTGNLYAALATGLGNLTGASTYKLYLWVDQGTAVIGAVEFWFGVGGLLGEAGVSGQPAIPSVTFLKNADHTYSILFGLTGSYANVGSTSMYLFGAVSNAYGLNSAVATTGTTGSVTSLPDQILPQGAVIAFTGTAGDYTDAHFLRVFQDNYKYEVNNYLL